MIRGHETDAACGPPRARGDHRARSAVGRLDLLRLVREPGALRPPPAAARARPRDGAHLRRGARGAQRLPRGGRRSAGGDRLRGVHRGGPGAARLPDVPRGRRRSRSAQADPAHRFQLAAGDDRGAVRRGPDRRRAPGVDLVRRHPARRRHRRGHLDRRIVAHPLALALGRALQPRGDARPRGVGRLDRGRGGIPPAGLAGRRRSRALDRRGDHAVVAVLPPDLGRRRARSGRHEPAPTEWMPPPSATPTCTTRS